MAHEKATELQACKKQVCTHLTFTWSFTFFKTTTPLLKRGLVTHLVLFPDKVTLTCLGTSCSGCFFVRNMNVREII